MDHVSIVRIREIYEQPQLCKMYIIMDLVMGECISKRIKSIQNRRTPQAELGYINYWRKTLLKVFQAVNYMHKVNIVHR